MVTWKIVETSKASILYIYIYIYIDKSSTLYLCLFFFSIFKRIFMLIIDSLKITTNPITWMYGYLEYWSFLESINFDLLSKSYLNVHCITTSKFGRIWEEQTQWFFRKFYYTQNFLSVYREPIMVIRLYMILYFSRNARGKKN